MKSDLSRPILGESRRGSYEVSRFCYQKKLEPIRISPRHKSSRKLDSDFVFRMKAHLKKTSPERKYERNLNLISKAILPVTPKPDTPLKQKLP